MCNFGGTAQEPVPPVGEEKVENDSATTEIIVPGGKEDVPEEDKETKEEKEEQKTQSKPFGAKRQREAT